MRLITRFFIVLVMCLTAQLWLVQMSGRRQIEQGEAEQTMARIVRYLGLSDLCIATDARYVRNPAVTDPLAPYMDHPGSIEHFPTGTFWTVN